MPEGVFDNLANEGLPPKAFPRDAPTEAGDKEDRSICFKLPPLSRKQAESVECWVVPHVPGRYAAARR